MSARSARQGSSKDFAANLMPLMSIAAAIVGLIVLATAHSGAHWAAMTLGMGPLATHMTQHILVMNLAAPFIAWAAVEVVPGAKDYGSSSAQPDALLAWAVAAQICVLWVWHAPAVFDVAVAHPPLLVAMHVSLLAVSIFFWFCILRVRGNARWKPIVSLLITGKLFCLLGALLVFAPRSLYVLPSGPDALGDQQLAGLLMIAACPLTYVLAGVVIAARWLAELENEASSVAHGVRSGF